MVSKILSFLISFLFVATSYASNLDKEIESIIKSTGEDLNIGIYVKELESGKVKFATHAERRFIPASTTKLFTTYAGLKYLGEDFRYNTTATSDHGIKKGVVEGNLYFRFSGDPSFSYEDLQKMLKKMGVQKITGNLIINDYLFDHYRTSPGGFAWDDKPFCYAAPNSAVTINGNCSEAKMWPGNIGKKASLEINNPGLLKIVNNVTTVKPRRTECPYKSRYIGDNTYEVYGCMFSNVKNSVRLNFALPDNRLMAKNYFEKALKDSNIKLQGKVMFANSSGKKALYTHRSATLKDTIVPLLRYSLNPDSSALFKYMGHKYTGGQGSDEAGENMMKRFLRKIGLKKGVTLKDGSGGSRYNLITPKALVALLENAYKSDEKDVFIGALPSYGEGSLRYRTVSPRFNHYIRAKTGGMKNVSSIAGYYLPKHGKKYAFAIMINGHGMLPQEAKGLEDKILNVMFSS